MGAESERTALKEAIKASIPRALLVRRLDRQAKNSVLLTFDDGPDPAITPAVLDRLDDFGAKAVFFLVGRRLKRAPDLPREILARGHLIGNHSYLHHITYVTGGPPRVGFRTYYRDLRRCQERVRRQVGQPPRLFRPPGGRLAPETLIAPRLLGLTCVTWTQDVRDWSFQSDGEGVEGANLLLRQVAPRDIILLHDNNVHVLALLDTLLPGLRGRGFDLESGVSHL